MRKAVFLRSMQTGQASGEVTFPAENGVATITHTFVDDSLRGQGVASQILAEAAEQIRASGLRMNATCHVAAKWIASIRSSPI